MSAGMIEAVTGHLPATNENKDQSVKDLSIYLPVAVFGYLGYQFGFDTVVVIPLPIPDLNGFRLIVLLDEVLFPVSYFWATVYTATVLIFMVHLTMRAKLAVGGWHNSLILLIGFVAILGSTCASLWGIYESELYTASIIGLILSIAQLLFAANIIMGTISGVVYAILDKIATLLRRLTPI